MSTGIERDHKWWGFAHSIRRARSPSLARTLTTGLFITDPCLSALSALCPHCARTPASTHCGPLRKCWRSWRSTRSSKWWKHFDFIRGTDIAVFRGFSTQIRGYCDSLIFDGNARIEHARGGGGERRSWARNCQTEGRNRGK